MKSEITTEHKAKISEMLNDYLMKENWQDAKALLESELSTAPDDHFLLTQLGEVFYEMRDYNTAIRYTQRAYELAPDCPLALNNHAVVLYMHNKNDEAIAIWQSLLNKDLHEIAHNECAEGLQFAKTLLNDIRFRIGDAYHTANNNQKALEYFKMHLANRKRGQMSNFTKTEVENEIKNIENGFRMGK